MHSLVFLKKHILPKIHFLMCKLYRNNSIDIDVAIHSLMQKIEIVRVGQFILLSCHFWLTKNYWFLYLKLATLNLKKKYLYFEIMYN